MLNRQILQAPNSIKRNTNLSQKDRSPIPPNYTDLSSFEQITAPLVTSLLC